MKSNMFKRDNVMMNQLNECCHGNVFEREADVKTIKRVIEQMEDAG